MSSTAVVIGALRVKGKNWLLLEQILSFMSRLQFGKVSCPAKQTESYKSHSPFVEIAGKY